MKPTAEEMLEYVKDMMTNHPYKFLQYMVLVSGRECVKINASELKLDMEADIEESRYKIYCDIRVEPIKNIK